MTWEREMGDHVHQPLHSLHRLTGEGSFGGLVQVLGRSS